MIALGGNPLAPGKRRGETGESHFIGTICGLSSDAESAVFWILWLFWMLPTGAARPSCETPIPPFRLCN